MHSSIGNQKENHFTKQVDMPCFLIFLLRNTQRNKKQIDPETKMMAAIVYAVKSWNINQYQYSSL
jgi:hypothetical protein